MVQKLLIANRGEIALRVARTCSRLAIPVATVHSRAERNALHVRMIGESVEIGDAPAAVSYLNVAAILEAAKRTGADAIHPGIGFLSEDPSFAAAVEAAGLTFIGPRPETMESFGDKWTAKHQARLSDIPVIDGSEGSSDNPTKIEGLIRHMRLPVVLKAVAGGGGRGVRIVRSLDDVGETIDSAMREAKSSFGRPHLIVENLIEPARHLEVQIAGDGRGNAIHLFERECSLQRRFQKIVEEAPAISLSPAVRENLTRDAVRLASRIAYRGVGTIEFLVSGEDYYFLECNPRLQVEHTVTEVVTGVDLVELQLRIASGEALPFIQDDIVCEGHALQARIYAEDPARGFLPATGTLLTVELPGNGIRIETGVETGSEITPHYDSMIGKLIARGADRNEALEHLRAAIGKTVILGVESNLKFLASLLAHPVVREGNADNRFIDREFADRYIPVAPSSQLIAIASCLWMRHVQPELGGSGPWTGHDGLLGWRLGDGLNLPSKAPTFLLQSGNNRHSASFGPINEQGEIPVAIDGQHMHVRLEDVGSGHFIACIKGLLISIVAAFTRDAIHMQGPSGACTFEIHPYLSLESNGGTVSGSVQAPMMGKVTKVNVKVGDEVKRGDVLVVLESMKMELLIEAPCDGTAKSVDCAAEAMVERHSVLVMIEPSDSRNSEEAL